MKCDSGKGDNVMGTAAIVFPNQLFAASPVRSEARDIFVLEHPHFFRAFRFNKKKLVFHRASMKAYAGELAKKGAHVHYVEQAECSDDGGLERILRSCEPDALYVADPCDAALNHELNEVAGRLACELRVVDSPQFMSDVDSLQAFFRGREHLSMSRFYSAQRKRFGILMDDGKPVGGKWSFDAQNRRALPKDITVPRLPQGKASEYVAEACEYIQTHFPDNPGSAEGFFYPVTSKEAQRWLRRFLDRRLAEFGPYEDAISKDRPFLFHSLLSPLLNAGLLTPADVIVQTL
ncbi:MAG: cryptochrome/photolyase family protein, partial [Planctomycetota bacterium]